MEATGTAAARCAVHEGAQASGTCARCGSFVCPLCLDPSSAFPACCAACRAREGADVMAWERSGAGWHVRWGRTVRDLLVEPTATFQRTRPGRFAAHVAFNALHAFAVGVVLSLLVGCLLGVAFGFGLLGELGDDGSETILAGLAVFAGLLVAYPLVLVVTALITQAFFALVFHGAAKLFGGRATLATSAWAVGYLSVAQVATLPLTLVSYVPLLGPFVAVFGWLLVGVWASLHLTTVARHHHELEGWRALLAGFANVLLLTALFAGTLALGVLLAIVSAP